MRKISDEFGVDANNPRKAYRIVRWFGTSREQYEFAHLVWAQIMVGLQDISALDKFTHIYATTSNKTFKAMALIGKICILSNDKLWDNREESQKISQELRYKDLDMQVFKLNTEFPDIVAKYLSMALQAYVDLGQIISLQGHTRLFHEFASLQIKIDAILNFKELHCLRYLQLKDKSAPAGKVAEVVFTFAQALCHIIIVNHLKFNNKQNDETISDNVLSESSAAQQKLQQCQDLITIFNLREISIRVPKLKYILEDIDKNTHLYLLQKSAISLEVGSREYISNGFYYNGREVLEEETVVKNNKNKFNNPANNSI